jgi:hypothetical protein
LILDIILKYRDIESLRLYLKNILVVDFSSDLKSSLLQNESMIFLKDVKFL